jgi:glycosyltransferase involved in cell wall biosynthesis
VSRDSGRGLQDKFKRAIAEIGLYFRLPRLSWLRLPALLEQALQNDWQPDCVLSMSVPFDSHMIGNQIAKKLHAAHAMFLSDPFPIWIAPGPYSKRPNRMYAFLQMSVTKKVFRHADALLAPTEEMGQLLRSTFDEIQDIHFVETLHVASADINERETTVCDSIYHVGQISAARCSGPVFRAMRQLAEDTGHRRDTIVFLGEVDSSFRAAVADLEESGFIRFDGLVSPETSREVMRQAKALLLIEADMEAGPFLPSKITDYAAAMRPVIIVSNPGSALERIVANQAGVLTVPHEANRIFSALSAVMDPGFDQQSNFYSLFAPDSVGARYFEGIEAACDRFTRKR